MQSGPFNFATEVRVRLPETDAMGIVFHGHFFTYLEVGRADYLRNLGLGEGSRPISSFDNAVVHAACDFRSPARFDDRLVIMVRLAEIRTTSFRFDFRIVHKRQNRLIATGESIHVAIDPERWVPVPVPDSFRQTIRRFEGPHLVEDPAPGRGEGRQLGERNER